MGKTSWLLSAALLLSACGTGTGGVDRDAGSFGEPLPGKFIWHDLVTDDRGAAERFYSGLLGWTFENAIGPRGNRYTLIRSNGKLVGGIVEREDPPGTEYSRWLPYVSVPDVDRAAALIEGSGGEVAVAPLDLGEIARAAVVRDPQGAVLGLLNSRIGDPDDAMAPTAGAVAWNELVTADPHAAADFYNVLTGLEASPDNDAGGLYLQMSAQGQLRAGIMQRPEENIEPFWLTHFGVDDIATATGRVAALGGEVLVAPSPGLREGQLAIVVDPTGAVLALHGLRRGGQGAAP